MHIEGRFMEHLMLRKFHAFRLKQDMILDHKDDVDKSSHEKVTSETKRKKSIVNDVVAAFDEKPKLGFMKIPIEWKNKLDIIQEQKACCCTVCGSIASRGECTFLGSFCSQKCKDFVQATARVVEPRDFTRHRGALHLLPDPQVIIDAIITDKGISALMVNITLVTKYISIDTFEGHSSSEFICEYKLKVISTPQLAHSYLCDTRDFIANITQYVLAHRRAELSSCQESFGAMRIIVYGVVEKRICLALLKSIRKWTKVYTAHLDEKGLAKRLKLWSKLPPTGKVFGLTSEFLSPSNWRIVIDNLQDMANEVLPSTKLQLLLCAAKEIYTLYSKEHTTKDTPSRVLCADDFLPVFIYCVCNSKLKEPLSNVEIMWALCSQELLHGEAGYYLTMLEASLEYVRATN